MARDTLHLILRFLIPVAPRLNESSRRPGMRGQSVFPAALLIVLAGSIPFRAARASGSEDFYDVHATLYDNENVPWTFNEFYGGHFEWGTEGFDNVPHGDRLATFGLPPMGFRLVLYTDTAAGKLDRDYRGLDSLTDYEVKFLFLSTMGGFSGRAHVTFHFRYYRDEDNRELINPQMFYWGSLVLPAEFSATGVEQVDRKAILSNFDGNREVHFHVDGIQAQHDDDFALFHIFRTWNAWYFEAPEHAAVSVSNLTAGADVTSGQRWNYEDMASAQFLVRVEAGEGRHLTGFEIALQDPASGEIVTNSVSFSTSPDQYTETFSTNLFSVAGSNVIQNVTTAPSVTTSGTPHIWYFERGVTDHFEEFDTTVHDCGYTGRQMFAMGADDLFDPNDRFRNIRMSLLNGTPTLSVPNSKTNRLYSVLASGTLESNSETWPAVTNAMGNAGLLTFPIEQDAGATRFFRGKVEVPPGE